MSTIKVTNIQNPSSGTDDIQIATNGDVTIGGLSLDAAAAADSVNLDASGRLLVGTSTTAYSSSYLTVKGGVSTPVGEVCIASTDTNIASDDDIGAIRFTNTDGGRAAQILAASDGTWGTNDYPGRLTFSTTANGASSPTERMRISSNGDVHTGTALVNALNSSNTGFGFSQNGFGIFCRSSANALNICRQTNDGALIDFFQAGTKEGSISVSGTTVSLVGAHLSRLSQIPGIDPHDKDQRPEILRGTVMSNLDEMCDWTCPTSGDCQDNEQLNKTKISDVKGDKNVAGVFQSWDNDDDTWVNDFYLAMTGDFVIRIAAGITVERGDLLMSAGDGTAKPQGDGFVQDKTIAKVTSTTVSCTYDDGSYCVPCVLMAC